MKLHFLGTGSCYPTSRRGVSALALAHSDGSVWLFDCGEGTQIQVQKASVSSQRISAIFITHLHGDHLFGLPGLLCTISSMMGEGEGGASTKVVEIYGPQGLEKFIRTALAISCSPLAFNFRVHEMVPIPPQYPEDWEWEEGGEDSATPLPSHPSQLPGSTITPVTDSEQNVHWPLVEDEKWRVMAGWLHHRVPTFGFVVEEKERPGTLDITRLAALGLRPGPVCAELKAGRTAVSETGQKIHPREVLGPPIPGRTLIILGDTSDASPLAHLTSECDVLVHEATHSNSLADKATKFGHSTPAGAVSFAKRVQARTLLLNHFSQRYSPTCETSGESVALLAAEAREAASDTDLEVVCTHDLFVYHLPVKPRA